MEESNSCSEWAGKRSAETAETLSKLRAQADESLKIRRRHLCAMETELNHRIQQVASELAHDLAETSVLSEKNTHDGQIARIDQLTGQIEQESQHQNQLKESLDALQQEKAELQEQLQAQTDRLQQQREAADGQIQELVASRDQACQALSELQAQPCDSCESLRQRVAHLEQVECGQTQRLAEQEEDEQKLKLQNTDLQELLSQRSEKETREAAELESLRAQRDALAARVGELEAAPPAARDTDREEQIADLQQRFEMAVDDVRQLKQKNAELLQTQMEAHQANQAASVDAGPLDWQAQKARLLASLEDEEGEPFSEERQQERSTIVGTVSITDRVVADKDQEIAELGQQLAALQSELAKEAQRAVAQTAHDPQETLLDEDESIQRERGRLEQLQQEWEGKLRQAELDISIERATLAREKAALEEKLATVQERSADDGQASDQRPRRRWLAALGIKSEDEDEEE
jgi:chromosome segregation ATPase